MNDLVTKIDIHNAINLSGAKRHMLTPGSLRKTILPVSIADFTPILNLAHLVIRGVFDGWQGLRKSTCAQRISAGGHCHIQGFMRALCVIELPPLVKTLLAHFYVPMNTILQNLCI